MSSSLAQSPSQDEILLPNLQHVLRQVVGDLSLRQQVEAICGRAQLALQHIDHIHLPPEIFDKILAGEQTLVPVVRIDDHDPLVTQVLIAVHEVNKLLRFLWSMYASHKNVWSAFPDELIDLEFDLVEGQKEPVLQHTLLQALPLQDQVVTVVHVFADTLRWRLLAFAHRLEYVLTQDNLFVLLAELEEHKHQLRQAIHEFIFSLIGVFAPHVRREDIFPQYSASVREAAHLRGALADLTYQINLLNRQIAVALPQQTAVFLDALQQRLTHFAKQPVYEKLWPHDKKILVEFRQALQKIAVQVSQTQDHGQLLGDLQQATEGFAKFLDALQAINQREMLIAHDRQQVQQALERLILTYQQTDAMAACRQLDEMVLLLGTVAGRSHDIDAARRVYKPMAVAQLAQERDKWHILLMRLQKELGLS